MTSRAHSSSLRWPLAGSINKLASARPQLPLTLTGACAVWSGCHVAELCTMFQPGANQMVAIVSCSCGSKCDTPCANVEIAHHFYHRFTYCMVWCAQSQSSLGALDCSVEIVFVRY